MLTLLLSSLLELKSHTRESESDTTPVVHPHSIPSLRGDLCSIQFKHCAFPPAKAGSTCGSNESTLPHLLGGLILSAGWKQVLTVKITIWRALISLLFSAVLIKLCYSISHLLAVREKNEQRSGDVTLHAWYSVGLLCWRYLYSLKKYSLYGILYIHKILLSIN